MDSLFETWKTKIPKYSEQFKKPLFEAITQYGGGAESSKVSLGKHFANAYELYMYAFFLGLYNNAFVPTPEGKKKEDFSHHIQYWGSKGNRYDRKDFTKLQDFIYMALVTKTDIDFMALEKGEISESDVIKMLLQTMESYTNGGLTLIQEKIEDNPNYFLQPTGFMDFLVSQ